VFEELETEALGRLPYSPHSGCDAAELATPPLPVTGNAAAAGNPWSAAELSGALPALPPSLGAGSVSMASVPSELNGVWLGGGAAMGGAVSGSDESCDTAMRAGSPRNSGTFNPLEAYGLLPTSLAEQVWPSDILKLRGWYQYEHAAHKHAARFMLHCQWHCLCLVSLLHCVLQAWTYDSKL